MRIGTRVHNGGAVYAVGLTSAANPNARVAPLPRPPGLEEFAGMWVALIDDKVVAAETTSHRLALRLLRDMDDRRRRQVVVEFVLPVTDSYIVGPG